MKEGLLKNGVRWARRTTEPLERALWAPVASALAPHRRPTLWITAHRTSPATTGTDRLARAIAPRVAQTAHALGFATHVTVSDDEQELAAALRRTFATVSFVPPHDMPLTWRAAHMLRREVATHPAAQFTFRNLSAPRRSASLMIVSLLDVIPLEYGAPYIPDAQRAVHRRALRTTVANAAAVVALSDSSLAAARRELGVDIENAFLAPAFSSSRPARTWRTTADLFPGAAPRPFMLVHGGSEPRKNVVTVVRAHRALPPSVRAAQPLVVLGGAWSGVPLSAVGVGDDDPHVLHLPYLDDELYADVFASAHIVLCPSTHEGFGLPVLDAMQASVPVLASNIPAHREVIGADTELLAARDAAAWAAAMQRMLDDASFAARSVSEGRARAAAFTPDRMAAGYESALELVRRRFTRR